MYFLLPFRKDSGKHAFSFKLDIRTNFSKLASAFGNILNDYNSGVDHLRYNVYAEALAEKIDQVSPPLTIGVFGRWGSGKSFLLKYVKNLLDRRQRQHDVDVASSSPKSCWRTCWGWKFRFCFRFVFFIVCFCSIVVAALWAAHPSMFLDTFIPLNDTLNGSSVTSQPNASDHSHPSRYVALSILLFFLLAVGVVVCGNNSWWSSELRGNIRVLLLVAFTKLPIKSHPSAIIGEVHNDDVMMEPENGEDDKSNEARKRYIFVNFNAWEYAGSDTLWAGIVTKLSQEIENEFGSVTSRLFRMFKISAVTPDVKVDGHVTDSALLFIYFPHKVNKKEMKQKMTQFGVVVHCAPQNDDWWEVEFSNIKEAKKAKEMLSKMGIQASFRKSFSSEQQRSTDQETLLSAKQTSPEYEIKCCYQFAKHPKTICRVPSLFWNILAMLAVISLPVITYTLVDILDLDVYRTGRAVPIVVQIISWLPAVGAASFVIIKFAWAMFHSQRTRIHSALAGAKSNMATKLGFMNKVKTEVQYITKLLECAEICHNRQYRVIISIDDLDRCALEKIKSVLEAVGILLSDPSSFFVCLIAVDSRVAVKCIEEKMGNSLLKSNVTGHEYLKKIINLPFCLPEVDRKTKKRLIYGLMDLANEITEPSTGKGRPSTERAPITNSVPHPPRERKEEIDAPQADSISTDPTKSSLHHQTPRPGGDKVSGGEALENHDSKKVIQSMGDVIDGFPIGSDATGEKIEMTKVKKQPLVEWTSAEPLYPPVPEPPLSDRQTSPTEPPEPQLSPKDFLYECRKFFYEDDVVRRHLEGNPRNIKRVFNVLSLTSWILHCWNKEVKRCQFWIRNSSSPSEEINLTKKLARNLVVWVVLIDQWPYRMSYLLEIIEDHDERSLVAGESPGDENISLLDVYKNRVQPEINQIYAKNDDDRLLFLDIHPDMFISFLQEIESCGLVKNPRELQRMTISLDQSLRQTIVRQREQFLCENNHERETHAPSVVIEDSS